MVLTYWSKSKDMKSPCDIIIMSRYHLLFPQKSFPYRYSFDLRSIPTFCDKFGQKYENSLSITSIIFVASDWINNARKKSNWKILGCFFTASTMKYFKSLVDVVDEQEIKSTFIWISPNSHTLSLSLSRSTLMYWSLVLQANLASPA